METLLERFIRYCKINTRSNEKSSTVPSSENQVVFAKMLAQELVDLGFDEVNYNPDNGFVSATIKSNVDHEVDTIGFIAHYDTADFNSENIQPRVIENYDGSVIVLNETTGLVSDPLMFPHLKELVGHTLIVTDGTTLLGADDKAGVVEIIEAMLILKKNPDLKHGEIRIAFDRMKKLVVVRISLMRQISERNLPTPWMGQNGVNLSMRASMRQRPSLSSMAYPSIQVPPKTR